MGSLSITKGAHFTELFPALLSRVMILLTVMDEVESQSMVRSLLMRISNLSMMGLVSCDPFIPYKFPSMHSFCKRFFINWFCSEVEHCALERPVISMLFTFSKFLSLLNRTAFNGQCWARHQWITILHYNRNNQLVFIIFYLSPDQAYIYIYIYL